jgi:exopolysaccharide biosynthesis protein
VIFGLLTPPSTNPVTLENVSAGGARVRLMTVRLTDPSVRVGVVLSKGFPGSDEPFDQMVRRTRAFAATNGAYFSKDTKKPIGDIVVGGLQVNTGLMGTAFTLTSDRKPDIIRVVRHRHYGWGLYETVLACGPALLLDGRTDVAWRLEGFRDPHVTGATKRMALGYTTDGRLLIAYIGKSVTFEQEAKVMKVLGCYEAMNLDGGASLAMYFDGKTVLAPGRKLTNLLTVWLDR